MITRTPLRVGSTKVWVDAASGTVRFGAVERNRTLMAGLAPACYLIASEVAGAPEAWVFDPEADLGWQFAPKDGMAAAVRTVDKPAWCAAIEATLPDPADRVAAWLEVGVGVNGLSASCSIPLGRLPLLQGGLMQHGLQLTYITQLSDVHLDD